MLTILLVRAGHTEFDAQGRIFGTLDVPLSDQGRQQAEDAAERLVSYADPIDAIYAGPGRSAQETAAILSGRLAQKPKAVEDLRNINQGLWQGMLYNDVKSKQPKVFRQWQEAPETVCPPEGESVAEARERLAAAVAKLAKRHKHQGTLVLVVPSPAALVLERHLRGEVLTGLCQPACSGASTWSTIQLPAPVKA
jgi:probable phosphoglycerate mutase